MDAVYLVDAGSTGSRVYCYKSDLTYETVGNQSAFHEGRWVVASAEKGAKGPSLPFSECMDDRRKMLLFMDVLDSQVADHALGLARKEFAAKRERASSWQPNAREHMLAAMFF